MRLARQFRFVRPGRDLEGDHQPVPGVDGGDGEGQIHELLLRKHLSHLGAHLFGDGMPRKQRQRLGPQQGGALAFREKRRFAPRRHRVESLLFFARFPRIFSMHIQAKRTAVKLRRPDVDQMNERLLDAALPKIAAEHLHALHRVGCQAVIFDGLAHHHMLLSRCVECCVPYRKARNGLLPSPICAISMGPLCAHEVPLRSAFTGVSVPRARNSSTRSANWSGISMWGEWPAPASVTSSARGIMAMPASAVLSGTTLSFVPHSTRVKVWMRAT